MSENRTNAKYSWYLDLTSNGAFSHYNYPLPGQNGLPLCEFHGQRLELLEPLALDEKASRDSPPDHCWACKMLAVDNRTEQIAFQKEKVKASV